jgi:hypothetical protein
LFSLLLLAVFEPITANAQAMWVIFYKTKVKDPIPGTLGGLYPNSSYFYNAASLKAQGIKRFAEMNSCVYGDKGFCRLDEKILFPTVMGINCRDNTYLYSGGPGEVSPEWQPIGKSELHRALKAAIC